MFKVDLVHDIWGSVGQVSANTVINFLVALEGHVLSSWCSIII